MLGSTTTKPETRSERLLESLFNLLTSERDEDNPFKFYFVVVNERRFKFIQANSQ